MYLREEITSLYPNIHRYVSCVLGCPYEGPISPEQVLKVSHSLLDLGCYEVSLGDTIGVGHAGSTAKLISALLKSIPPEKMAVHFHNTYGQVRSKLTTDEMKLGDKQWY